MAFRVRPNVASRVSLAFHGLVILPCCCSIVTQAYVATGMTKCVNGRLRCTTARSGIWVSTYTAHTRHIQHHCTLCEPKNGCCVSHAHLCFKHLDKHAVADFSVNLLQTYSSCHSFSSTMAFYCCIRWQSLICRDMQSIVVLHVGAQGPSIAFDASGQTVCVVMPTCTLLLTACLL